MESLKEAIEQGKVIIGADRTLKLLRKGELKEVYLSSNCPKQVKEDIEHYAKLHSIQLFRLKESNEELGVLCKKPFSISVIGI